MGFDVLDYLTIQDCLEAWFNHKKQQRATFSHRSVARLLGTSDPSVLKNVVNGRKQLSVARTERFIEIMDLEEQAGQYFRAMADFSRAKRRTIRESARAKMLGIRSMERPNYSVEVLTLLGSPIAMGIRELVSFDDFRMNAQWVADRIHPEISVEEADRILRQLVKLKLIQKVGGKWITPEPFMGTSAEVEAFATHGYHHQADQLATQHFEHDPLQERTTLLGFTVSIPSSRLSEFRAILYQKMSEAGAEIDAWEGKDTVLQVNIRAFPLTK